MSRPLVDFLATVPSQLTGDLVRLGPGISAARNAVEIFSWKSYYDGFLFLAGFWAICLFSDLCLRYLLPIAVVLLWAFCSNLPRTAAPVSESTLQTTIADISTVRNLMPRFPSLPPVPLAVSVRIATGIYLPYLLLTYIVPLRVIVGIAGTILISWRAPWAIHCRTSLWHNAYVRWAVYHVYSRLSGHTLPPMKLSIEATSVAPENLHSLRFLFDIYENQRWWMGLDWTAALLPNERPSWCSASHQPVSPPNVFTLPADSVVYLPSPTGRRMKRTASWSWEETEWKVLVKREGSGMSRVEKPLPTLKEENASLLSKAAGKMAAVSHDTEKNSTEDEEDQENETEDPVTDTEGWVYADNKWEGRSSKGGIGKYTRYRRWTRVAVLTETSETVEPGETGLERKPAEVNPPSSPSEEKSPLRQRLKTALTKDSSS